MKFEFWIDKKHIGFDLKIHVYSLLIITAIIVVFICGYFLTK
jgi:hypothetical protein